MYLSCHQVICIDRQIDRQTDRQTDRYIDRQIGVSISTQNPGGRLTTSFPVQQVRLQREDYWIKKLCTIYPYGLNERAKNSNLEQPAGKLFPPLPRFGNRREKVEKRRVNEPTKFCTTDTLLAYIAEVAPKTWSGTIFVESQKE